MAQSCYFESPYGWLQLSEDDAGLTACHFLSDEEEPVLEGPPSGRFLPQAAEELAQYFVGERESFDIPLSFHGTEFQNAVWKAACKIPYATTCTYQDIAAAVGNFRAAHAVGTAMSQCPLSFFCPMSAGARKKQQIAGAGAPGPNSFPGIKICSVSCASGKRCGPHRRCRSHRPCTVACRRVGRRPGPGRNRPKPADGTDSGLLSFVLCTERAA